MSVWHYRRGHQCLQTGFHQQHNQQNPDEQQNFARRVYSEPHLCHLKRNINYDQFEARKLIHVLASPTEGLSPLVVTPVNRECFCGYKDKVVTHCTYRFHRRPAHRQTTPSCVFYWHTGRHNVPIQVHRSRFSVAHFCESFCWRQRIGWNVSAQNRQRQNYSWFQWWIVRALFLEERDVSFNQGHLNELQVLEMLEEPEGSIGRVHLH